VKQPLPTWVMTCWKTQMLAGCSSAAKPVRHVYQSIAWQHAVLFFAFRRDRIKAWQGGNSMI
jgi:hypothetical protein